MKSLKGSDKAKEKYLVLEVGNYNTKLIEVSPLAGKILVNKGFIIATPEGTLEDDAIIKSDQLEKELAEKIKEEKITAKNVTISLSSSEIITREMAAPKMSKRDTLSFIKINAKDLFPVDLNDYTLGYVSMGKGENSKLFIIAIPNDIILPYINITEKLGLVLRSINFSGFELYNLIDFEMGRDSETYAVVDLGSKNTNFIIVSRRVLMYNKVLKVGSDDITKAIAGKFKCTLTKAEKMKRDYNSVIMEGSLKNTDNVYVVAEIIRDVLQGLLYDISSIIEYYNNNHTKDLISKVYIIGLATKISGISEFVEETLAVNTEKIREFERVIFDEDAKAVKRRQVTLENCLGAVSVDDKKVDLIKGKLQLSKYSGILNPTVYKSAIVIAFLMILSLFLLGVNNHKIKERTLAYDEYISTKGQQISLLNEYSSLLTEVNLMEKIISGVPAGKEKNSKVIEYISQVLKEVDDISITSFRITDKGKVLISFSANDVTSADRFDWELKDYFDFESKFYNADDKKFSDKKFSHELTLRSDV